MEVKHISCIDCQTEWVDVCYVCKKRAWQIKTVRPKRIRANKIQPKAKKRIKTKRREESLRAYFLKTHPKRVVSLIMLGHDAACKCCFAIDDLTFDHVTPLNEGGKNSLRNGQILCFPCNQKKGGRIISIEELRTELNLH